MRDILKLGENLERLIGCVYEGLATHLEPGSPERAALKKVAGDEFVHARVMGELAIEVEEMGTGVHLDYRRVRDEQLRMLEVVTAMLCEFHSEEPNLNRILKEMLDMEKSLAENLFQFLAFMTSLPSRQKVQRLAEQSNEHADRPFDLILLDLTVAGGLGGQQTIEMIRRIDPEVIGLVASGYTDSPVLSNPTQFGFTAKIAKPYPIAEVSQVIDGLMGPASKRKPGVPPKQTQRSSRDS